MGLSHLLLQAQWTNILHNSDNSTHNYNMKAVLLIVVAVVVICDANPQEARLRFDRAANRAGVPGAGGPPGLPGASGWPGEGGTPAPLSGAEIVAANQAEKKQYCEAKILLWSGMRTHADTIINTARGSVDVIIAAGKASPGGVKDREHSYASQIMEAAGNLKTLMIDAGGDLC